VLCSCYLRTQNSEFIFGKNTLGAQNAERLTRLAPERFISKDIDKYAKTVEQITKTHSNLMASLGIQNLLSKEEVQNVLNPIKSAKTCGEHFESSKNISMRWVLNMKRINCLLVGLIIKQNGL
jgi:hypothetical protein